MFRISVISCHFNQGTWLLSYLQLCSAIFAESSPVTFPCWQQWPALTPPMWPRFCYETNGKEVPSCQRKPVRPGWCHSGPINSRPCSAADPPPTQFHVLGAWAKRDVCSQPEQRMSFGPPPQPASPLTITAAEVVAMLMLHHRGELETTVPQMERGSAGIPVMTFSCRLNVSFKTRLFYFWTQKPKTEYIFSVENETLICLQHNNNGFCFFCLLFFLYNLKRTDYNLKENRF